MSRRFAWTMFPAQACVRRASVVAGAGVLASTLVSVALPAVPAAASHADVTARTDTASAVMSAREQGSRVEITNERTSSSSTFANPDGTFTSEISAVPYRALTGDGWRLLDPTLVPAGQGRLQPKLSAAPLSLSGDGSGDAVSLTSGKKSLRLNWVSALPTPTV